MGVIWIRTCAGKRPVNLSHDEVYECLLQSGIDVIFFCNRRWYDGELLSLNLILNEERRVLNLSMTLRRS